MFATIIDEISIVIVFMIPSHANLTLKLNHTASYG